MKKIVVLIVTFYAQFTFASGYRECARATDTVGDIIRNYTEILKSCRETRDSSIYYKYQVLARRLERLYPSAVAECRQACSFDAFSQDICDDVELWGACP